MLKLQQFDNLKMGLRNKIKFYVVLSVATIEKSRTLKYSVIKSFFFNALKVFK